MRAHDLEELAAKLHTSAPSLAALDALTAAQVALLSDLIDAACARERDAVAAAFDRALPLLPPALVLDLLGGRER